MIYPQLVSYIKNSLAKNISLEQTKKTLIAKGWRESDVKEAIALVSQPKPTGMKPTQTPTGNKPKKTISPTIIFAIAGIFAVVLIIGLVVYLLLNMTPQISDTEILQGASVSLGTGKEVKFNVNSEEHRVLVNSVGGNSAVMTVYSDPVSLTLFVGEERKIDFNSDNVYDLLVRLNSIINQEADIYIQKISETICTEDWTCTDWTTCIAELQNRTCTDANACGTEESKPDETQICIVQTVLTCAERNGTVCEIFEECGGTLEDGCCIGDCARIETTECGTSFSCLINASDTCHPANMTQLITSSNLTVQNVTFYYNIEGFEDEDGERCEFYTGISKVEGNFTASEWDMLLTAGLTVEQITSILEDLHSSLTDSSETCIFQTDDLEDYLTKVDEENYQLTDAELTLYECTGDLFD